MINNIGGNCSFIIKVEGNHFHLNWNYNFNLKMKESLIIYFGICVLALTLKYIIGKLNNHFGKNSQDHDSHHHSIEENTHAHNHEEEHFIAHLIKYFLLILFAIFAYKLLNGNFNQHFS